MTSWAWEQQCAFVERLSDSQQRKHIKYLTSAWLTWLTMPLSTLLKSTVNLQLQKWILLKKK